MMGARILKRHFQTLDEQSMFVSTTVFQLSQILVHSSWVTILNTVDYLFDEGCGCRRVIV